MRWASGRRGRAARPGVERVDREVLQVTMPDGRTLRTGCDSFGGVLSVWLVPGQCFTDGGPVSADDAAWIEREVASHAAATGHGLSVNRT